MLQVVSPEKAEELIRTLGIDPALQEEKVALLDSPGRLLYTDIRAVEDVPAFTRSSVDGYAVLAADTFGCSESIPAMLALRGMVEMGHVPPSGIGQGECMYVPTGGQIPAGSDAMVMKEHTESYGENTIGIWKPTAPGRHCVFRGDDTKAGAVVLKKGTRLRANDIGTLAALGITEVPVVRRLKIGILSTGDEVVPVESTPGPAQVRDVNAPMLAAAVAQAGCRSVYYGICKDDAASLEKLLSAIVAQCDAILVSGGTSVGMKDAAPQVMEALGRIVFHGIAVKPGKPTLFGEIEGKPIFALPGHPVAAYFIFREFVSPLLRRMQGLPAIMERPVAAKLAAAIPSNHGRAEFVAVKLSREGEGHTATPIPGKSGLISILSRGDGYIRIPRDTEGIGLGETVMVLPFR